MRRRVLVGGVVQGVGFRVSVARRAQARGLGGWVHNLPDGRVEAVFEGADDDVESLVAYCREGPRGSDVSRVEVIDEEPQGLSSFDVR